MDKPTELIFTALIERIDTLEKKVATLEQTTQPQSNPFEAVRKHQLEKFQAEVEKLLTEPPILSTATKQP